MSTVIQPDYANLPSSQLARDARESIGSRGVDPGRIAIGVIIGRTSEFFDFFVYCIASVLVFPTFLFPRLEPMNAMLASFAIFSLAFVARPIGSLIFMRVDRKHGRGVKLTAAMFLLGFATAAMAFLPGYADIGYYAVWFLVVLRFLQGLGLGGTWDGLASLLALNAPANKRGWYAMMPQLGAPLGFMLASALFAYFVASLSEADFIDWGWRFPFFVAFAINVVALFARLRLVMTSEFATLLDRNELQAERVRDTFRANGKSILIGAFVPLASYALFHLVTVFPLSWVVLFTKVPTSHFLIVQIVGGLVGAGTIVLSGIFADMIGRRRLLGWTAVLIGLGSFLTPFLYEKGIINEDVIVVAGFAMLGLSFGQASGAVASNFERTYRYSASAITSDLAWLIGAGFAPLVALELCNLFGLVAVGAYLLSGAIATLFALYFNHQLLVIRD
jgi:MFS family permease